VPTIRRVVTPLLGTVVLELCAAVGAPTASLPHRPAPPAAEGQSRFAGVLTWHNDLARTGQNLDETALTPSNVRRASFGKRFARVVDGMIYAQPLYMPRVRVPGVGVVDVVVVATEHDSVYAFDARGRSARPLWHTSFIDPKRGITTVPCTKRTQPECDPTILVPEHGITATPVIDQESDTLFVHAKTLERGKYVWRLHALDLSTGAERPNSPVEVAAVAPGFPRAKFDAKPAFGRSGLLLVHDTVYLSYASNDDARGWVIGYDARSLARVATFCAAPTGALGGVWMAGAAPAVDPAGAIYLTTGNGSFDADTGGSNFGMSLLRLQPSLTVTDYFAPKGERLQSEHDLDFASSGVMVLPDESGPHPREAVAADKHGSIFLVDRDHLGEFDRHANHVIEQLHGNIGNGGFYSDPAYFNGAVYYAPGGAALGRYTIVGGLLSNTPVSQSPDAFNYPGATPAISANGFADAIVWTVAVSGRPAGGPPAELRAYDARDASIELYSSAQAGIHDRAAPGTKFSVPTVAAGMVYFGTQTELEAYGLLR
jgi:hypothetical protein